jgi:hypothetical protein
MPKGFKSNGRGTPMRLLLAINGEVSAAKDF